MTNNTEHTPAPWHYEIDKCGVIHYRVYNEESSLIAAVHSPEKHARIIAAAPELLRDAESLINVLTDMFFNNEIPRNSNNLNFAKENLKKVIAKARGE